MRRDNVSGFDSRPESHTLLIIAIISITLVYLTPYVRASDGAESFGLRLEQLLVPFALFYVLVVRRSGVVFQLQQKLLLLFGCMAATSILFGIIVGTGADLRDLSQVVRVVYYVAFFTLIQMAVDGVSSKAGLAREKILSLVIFLSSIVSVVVFQQYFDVLGLNSHYVEYVAPTQYHTLVDNYPVPRPVGFVGNPNELAYLLAIGVLVAVFRCITERPTWLLVVLAIVNSLALMTTLSRTGMVFLFSSLLVLLIITIRRERIIRLLFLFIVVVTPLGIVAANENVMEFATWRYLQLLNISEATSWTERVSNWHENWALFESSPYLGVGPLRTVSLQFSADNEWLLLLRSYGVIGTAMFVLSIAGPIFVRLSRTGRSPNPYLQLYIAVAVGTAIYMVPASAYHTPILFPIFLTIAALGLAEGNVSENMENTTGDMAAHQGVLEAETSRNLG